MAMLQETQGEIRVTGAADDEGIAWDPWAYVDDSPDRGRMLRLLEDRGAQPDQVDVRRRFWEWVNVHSGTAILEVGCGTGVWAREAAAVVGPDGQVLGIDPSRSMVDEARRLARERGAPPHLSFAMADGAALPFPEGTWELVLTATVLGHVENQSGLMREMARVARREGRVVAFDQDQETFVVNHSDRKLTRRILNLFCDRRQTDGWSGRRIFGLMQQMGLCEVRCLPLAWVDGGLFITPGLRHYISLAHSDEEVTRTLEIVDKAARETLPQA